MKRLVMDDKIVQVMSSRIVVVDGKIHAEAANMAIDFDPNSLRNILPKAVSSLEWAISKGKGRVYWPRSCSDTYNIYEEEERVSSITQNAGV
ncbi:hypothetical protein Ahy_B06g080464 isoform E [Arachis hypogaea]|uniref:Uncharacterized protein n=1 Tax=Arachis hypogaea TaxID=3818 RepID=A0A444YI15_ARAHY|nr:hypothetical protein Ahy_B06g080464 isoform E [Arachis hypogaea]